MCPDFLQLQEETEGFLEEEPTQEGEDEFDSVIEGLPMTVTIGLEEGGKQLKFNCLAAHELVIDSITMVCGLLIRLHVRGLT